jgi:YD repeat-containing protein
MWSAGCFDRKRGTTSRFRLSRVTWTYSGGLYTDRMFFGYSNVTETDPNGNTLQYNYDQRQLFVGQEDSESVTDSSNNLRYQKYNTWTAATAYQGELTSTSENYIDPQPGGGTAGYGTQANFSFDGYLNQTQVYRNPNTSVGGLDSTTVYQWANNAEASIWSLPAAITEYACANTNVASMLSNTTFIYDDQPFGQATLGRLTSQQEAVQVTMPLKSVVKTNTYDQYGNVIAIKDRNGNTTSFTYDTQTSTNRVSAIDPDGNSIASTFDPRFGAVLSDTDASGNTTSFQYDAFGRLAMVIKPGDANLGGGTTNFIYSPITGLFPTGFSVTRRDSMPNAAPLVSVDLYDSYALWRNV